MYRFTGNPFVDAGIAGMCAAAGVDEPAQLDESAVQRAVERLLRLFTSPQALESRPKPGDEKKASAFATSELSAIFPNGPHSNPSNKGEKKVELYRKQITDLVHLLGEVNGSGVCFACGSRAVVNVTKMDFPLMDSRRNFHPALAEGHEVCARCALAIQFLPISVLRTSLGGLFWFVSCLDPEVSVPPAAELNLPLMESCVAGNRRLRLYGDWAVPGRASAVVGAVDFLSGRKRKLKIGEDKHLPVRAVFFSNDNRGGEISVVDVPTSLFRFFHRLRSFDNCHEQFVREVLHVPKFGESVAQRLLEQQPIVKSCVVGGDLKNPSVRLLGGWMAHTRYMKEVLGMKERYISTVEEIALRIADREDADRKLKDLRTARESFLWLQRAISERLMTRQEFYLLVPPNDGDAAAAALDYISAATAEALRCREESNEFRRFPVLAELSEDSTMHPLIRLVEDTGRAICKSGYDPKKLIDNLRSARYLSDLRWAWLRALQAKAIRWTDFVALVPPKDTRTPYVIRDYMLAFLYDTTDAAPAMLEAGPAEVIAP